MTSPLEIEILKYCSFQCSRRQERIADRLLLGTRKVKDHLEDLCVDWSILLKYILKKLGEIVDWINSPQDRNKWRSDLNAVKIIQVPRKQGIS
jgi:hypothetical protein